MNIYANFLPKNSLVTNTIKILSLAGVLALTAIALPKYPGNGFVFLLFTAVSNLLLYSGFRKDAIFFDTFIGVLCWLGFWLKLAIRVAFFDGRFSEATGAFDGSGVAFDRALIVASCGLFGFLLASLVREKFFFRYPKQDEPTGLSSLLVLYRKYRPLILSGFVVLLLFVALTNAYFGIYQRGSITRTVLPFGLNGVYTWLLLFGLATFSALLLKFESSISTKPPYLVLILGLLESFASNVSMLSRGMILNSSALLLGAYYSVNFRAIRQRLTFFAVACLSLMVLFAGSVVMVNSIRTSIYLDYSNKRPTEPERIKLSQDQKATESINSNLKQTEPALKPTTLTQNEEKVVLPNNQPDADQEISKETTSKPALITDIDREQQHKSIRKYMTKSLFIDRWVGIEGVMAVSSHLGLGWTLWSSAWEERYNEHDTSFYDKNLIASPYAGTDKNKHHFISLPGAVAFFFYPGSLLFLMFSMLTLGLIAAAIEIACYRLGGRNLILCSLVAQVVAFRFTSLGYVPKQSYLLFGTITLNLILIVLAEKLADQYCRKKLTD